MNKLQRYVFQRDLKKKLNINAILKESQKR